ncbi:unnamed protein product [Dibothriocephalus latus]|uniref:G-protein coupled receptors family 1 profile domain-containing protein n=1 Tax=Dibothriocephalus latus TaxID=60516 RepID=A0A3P6PT39_DIBLA|nr:unnamed protein product [Dibothriocephalus latus]
MTGGTQAFWSCSVIVSWPNGLDICEIMLNVFGFLANLLVTVLLFLLCAKKSVDLALLRVLSLSCLVSTFMCFFYDVVTPGSNTGNMYFDGLVCIFFRSRFLYWYSRVHVYHSLFFFAYNRAFGILKLRHYPHTTEKHRLYFYMFLVFTASFLSAAPQMLQARPHVKNCACATPTTNFALLSAIYAHAFLWVAILGFIYPAIFLCICTVLLVRLRGTERGVLVDDLEELAFPEPRPSSSYSSSQADAICTSSSTSSESSNGRQRGTTVPGGSDEVSAHHVWSASFCIIPLSAAYIATFTYDSTYQLLSAMGYLTYVMNSPTQQFSEVLLTLFTALVPLILFYHIPAMRSLIFVAIASVQKKFGKIEVRDLGETA